MTSVIVVDSATLEFVNIFPVGANGAVVMGPNPQVTLETSEDPLILMAVKDADGTITLAPDPAKVAAKKDALWSQLRTDRNSRLAASDYTQLQDAHISQDKKDAWAAYRQALRDLPDELTDPTDAVPWPLKPGELPPVVPVASSRFGALLEQAGVPEVQAVEEVPEVQEVVEPVVESEPVPEVQEVAEVPVVEEVQEVVEVPVVEEVQEVTESEPVPEVQEVTESEPVVEVPEVPEPAPEPVPEVPEPVPEVPEVPEVPASEPAPVELAASEPVV